MFDLRGFRDELDSRDRGMRAREVNDRLPTQEHMVPRVHFAEADTEWSGNSQGAMGVACGACVEFGCYVFLTRCASGARSESPRVESFK